MQSWVLLAVAIVAEVVATIALRFSNGLTRLWPIIIVVVGYAAAIWLLSLSVKSLYVSVVYAVWAGVGTALVAVAGALFLGEGMTWAKAGCLGLIIAGVVGLNLVGDTHSAPTARATVSATVGHRIADGGTHA